MTTSPAVLAGWQDIESRAIVAPLGIRFWDAAFDVPVSDGLAVTAYPQGLRSPGCTPVCTPNGIYAFRRLAGLQAVEYPDADQPGFGSLPPSARFLVEVEDSAGRFLPTAFFVDAPQAGVYPTSLPPAPGGAAPPGFYLFSAPTRPASPLLGCVRAQLSEIAAPGDSSPPAAYAVMQIDAPGSATVIGVADANGAIAVMFAYPNFTGPAYGASLPTAAASAPQSWPITLSVRYQPSALVYPPNSSLPELRSVLSQAPGVIWTQRSPAPGQAVKALPATLTYGQILVLQTAQETVLFISP
jgi:hypothetical protein